MARHKVIREDDSIKNLAIRASRKNTTLVKFIEKYEGGAKMYQGLDHTIYYKLGNDVYPKIPIPGNDLPALYVTLEEISLEEFDKLYTLQR